MFVLLGLVFKSRTHHGTSYCANETVSKLVASKSASCTSGQSAHQTSLAILRTGIGVVRVIWCLIVRSTLGVLVRWRWRAVVASLHILLLVVSAILLLRLVGILVWSLAVLKAASGRWAVLTWLRGAVLALLLVLLVWVVILRGRWRLAVSLLWWLLLVTAVLLRLLVVGVLAGQTIAGRRGRAAVLLSVRIVLIEWARHCGGNDEVVVI